MAKVSVIVPVYNVEKYLKKCLETLVKQTLQDIEIIVVNDGANNGNVIFINLLNPVAPSKLAAS